MMLVKYALAAVSTIFATSLIAAPVSKSLNVADEPHFDTIKEFQADIPNGISVWELNFDEAQASAADISIWHQEQVGCRGFNITQVRAKAPGEEGAWSVLAVNLYQGVAHFKALESFDKVELTLSNDRLRTSFCNVQVRKANFVVPQLITMIAKLEAPTCQQDNGDISTAENCVYSATRVDINTRQLIILQEAQVERMRLVTGGFYKLRGYNKTNDDGTTFFDILDAERVM
jgi:hypothetical protein